MNFEAMPVFRFEVERLKQSIVAMMGARGSELGEYISAEVDKSIAVYDWEGQVRKVVTDAINEQIKNYFSYGKGAVAIREAIEAGFKVPQGDN